MLINDAIKKVMKKQNVTQVIMAKGINASSQSVVAKRLKTQNLGVDTALEMLELLGFEMVIQERKPGRRPEGQILIERSKK